MESLGIPVADNKTAVGTRYFVGRANGVLITLNVMKIQIKASAEQTC